MTDATKIVDLELEIEGMTCTACARRVEKGLNKLPGVVAYVDFATEKAHISASGGTDSEDYKAAIDAAGYSVGTGKSELAGIRPRLIVGGVLSTLAVIVSMGMFFTGWQWAAFIFSTPVIIYVTSPFHIAAFKNLKLGSTTMDTLVSLGSSVAYIYSLYQLFFGNIEQVYFEVAAVVPTVVLFGRWLEVRARRSATDSVRALLSAIPTSSRIIRDGEIITISTSDIRIGDRVVVSPGESVPVDGEVVAGFTTLDNSTMTGESVPIEITSGEKVHAGSVNLTGGIEILATANSASSRLGQIADLVREATAKKTKLTSIADSISAVFVPIVIVIALGTYLVWAFVIGDQLTAFEASVAVLVIACPCALGIAVPMSLVVATSVGAKRGVVIREPDSLTLLAKIKTVMLDKTGTLTEGKLVVTEVIELAAKKAEISAFASAVESNSKHPIAKAIASYETDLVATDLKEISGVGVTATVSGKTISVFKPAAAEVTNASQLQEAVAAASVGSLVVVIWDGQAQGLLVLTDKVRTESKKTISDLNAMGIESVLVSGDNKATVQSVATELGIDKFFSDVTPEDKLGIVENQKKHSKTAMVGDGLNDVAALTGADIGIAMGSGSHAAQSASAITILDDSPLAIPFSLKLSRKTWNNIRQNLGWAFGYNILLIPVAAAGFLNPMFAGAAMAFSSISVVLNSLRLRKTK